MLHEEVHLNWDEMQVWVDDHQLIDVLKNDLVVGVS